MALLKTKQIDGTLVPEWLIDLFGRMKVSLPYNQVTINQSSTIAGAFSTGGQVSGSGGTVTFLPNESTTQLSVANTASLLRFRSVVSGIYQPGKPLLIYQTFVLGTGNLNVNKRVGYMFGSNGIYLEQRGATELSICLSSGVTGSQVITRVLQANWNVDKFDGTQTGYNFDVTKGHIMFIAIEWLGVGDIVVGFFKDRTPVVAHVFSHSNLLSNVSITTPNLFPTWELDRTTFASSGPNTTLKAICATILIEGSNDFQSTSIGVVKTTSYATGTANLWRPLILFRLNPSNVNSLVLLKSVSLLISSIANCLVCLVKNPTFSGAYTPVWDSKTGSSLQTDQAITSALSVTNVDTNGYYFQTLFSNSSIKQEVNYENTADYLTSNFVNTPDTYALCIRTDANNTTVLYTALNFTQQL